jgi:hypothetical protein
MKMTCPNCGNEMPTTRNALISQLAKISGVKEIVLRNLSIEAARALIFAWRGLENGY